jgi:glutathione S-transferase
MKLVGALSSPYTRRVAITLSTLGVLFEHEPVSVFSELPKFRAINPVVRAPTVSLDDGTLLMESNVIVEYFDRAAGELSLWPREDAARRRCAALLGVAQTACDKTVQLVYERGLRPVEKQFSDWVSRVTGQITAACELLESQIETASLWLTQDRLTQAGIMVAVVSTFMQHRIPDVLARREFPKLFAFRDEAEALAVFRQWPHPAAHAALPKAPLWS